jgi:hypothetical protein
MRRPCFFTYHVDKLDTTSRAGVKRFPQPLRPLKALQADGVASVLRQSLERPGVQLQEALQLASREKAAAADADDLRCGCTCRSNVLIDIPSAAAAWRG